MRIAIVAESFLPRINGVSNSVVRISQYFKAQGHDVLILAPDAYTAEIFEEIPVVRIRSIEIPGIHDTDVAVITTEKLERVLREFKPDVVHVASPFVLGGRAIKAAKNCKIPTVAVFQTDVAGFARHYGLGTVSNVADSAIRKIHSQVALTLVPSSDSANYLNQLGVERVARWGRGVDLKMFNPSWRENDHFGDSNLVNIGFLGRLAPEKSIDMLTAVTNIPHSRVVIIGDGPDRQRLQNLLPNALFLGRLGGNDLSQAVASLDIMITPGEKETFCQVIQESMAAGVPVIAPAVGGPKDLVTHNHNGLLYAPGNREQLELQTSYLVRNAQVRRTMSVNARETVQDRSWDEICGQLITHYENAISLSSGALI